MRPWGLTLLIDADDTLCENNIYFEAVVEAFCGLIAARGGSRPHALDRVERIPTSCRRWRPAWAPCSFPMVGSRH